MAPRRHTTTIALRVAVRSSRSARRMYLSTSARRRFFSERGVDVRYRGEPSYLFRDGDLGDFLRERNAAAVDAVEQVLPSALLNSPAEELASRIASQFSIAPLEVYADQVAT